MTRCIDSHSPQSRLEKREASRSLVVAILVSAVLPSTGCKESGEEQAGQRAPTGLAAKHAVKSEVNAMFAELRIREESYHLESGTYLSTGTESNVFPSVPGSISDSDFPESWKQLRVHVDPPQLQCGYAAVAGPRGSAENVGTIGKLFRFVPPPTNWFYLIARCPSTNRLYFTAVARDEISSKSLDDAP